MKTLFTLLLLAFFTVAACDDSTNENQDNTAAQIMEVENRAINGQQWRITNFRQANSDQTSIFNGYIFEFDSNNLLTSTNGSENLAGTWAVKTSGNDDEKKAEFDNLDFSIVFTNPTPFVDLAGNWKISSLTDSTIELRHLTAGKSQPDVIRFERI
jgi:hypothetical protein